MINLNGYVPTGPYIVRFIKGEKATSGSGMIQIVAKLEIITPDLVPNPNEPDKTLSVAGRTATAYMSIDPRNKMYDQWRVVYANLGLLPDGGETNAETIISTLNSGTLFAEVVLNCEQDFHRYPAKPGQKIGDIMKGANGKELSKGWRLAPVGPGDIMSKVDAIQGASAAPDTNSPY